MTRNNILISAAVVIVIGGVTYALTNGSGPAANGPTPGPQAEATAPVAAPVGEVSPSDQPMVDESKSQANPSAAPSGPAPPADAKATKPQASASAQGATAKLSWKPGAQVPKQGMHVANGYRRSGMRIAFLMMGIGNLEESGKEPLTAAQAKKILALVEPLRAQKTLDVAQAEQAAQKVSELLTDNQKQAMMSGFGAGFGRSGGPGGQPGQDRPNGPGAEARQPRPGGPNEPNGDRPAPPNGQVAQRPSGGPNGARPPAFKMPANPLNPGNDSPFAPRMKAVFDKLKAKAK